MYNHAPEGYISPFTKLIERADTETIESDVEDIIFQDEHITAFISSRWWPNNPGHVMIVPNQAFENLYDIPEELLTKVHAFSKRLAIAFKEVYQCDGVSVRQHNEPAGNQDVWHYHLHVFPRYVNDELYVNHPNKRIVDAAERAPYAEKLRTYFESK